MTHLTTDSKQRFRLKAIHRASGISYVPQIHIWWFIWKTLDAERTFPEVRNVFISNMSIFSYEKDKALEIIEVYKQEQQAKRILKTEFEIL